MSKSIMQQDKEACYICGARNTEEHHCIYGIANRKLSEKYGLKIYLCNRHHTASLYLDRSTAVHFNRELDLTIKEEAQKAFIKKYPNLSFIKIFGKNYLEEEI